MSDKIAQSKMLENAVTEASSACDLLEHQFQDLQTQLDTVAHAVS